MDTSLLLQRRLPGLEYVLEGVDRALDADSSELRRHLVHAVVQDQLGLDDAAVGSLDAALHLDSRNLLGRTLKADWFGRQERSAEGVQLLDKARPGGPGAWFAESTLGSLLWAVNDLVEARTHLETATAGSPDHPLPYARLGEAFRLLNEYDDALAAFSTALGFAPRSAYVHERLGDVYRMLGRLPEAMESLQRAADIEDLTSFGWATYADVQRQRGDLEDAASAFEKAIALEPSNAFTMAWQADVHHSLGRIDEALHGIETAIALDPDLWFCWGVRAAIMRDLKRYREAGRSVAKALALAPDPGNPWLLYWSGLLNLETGEIDESISALRAALEAQPDQLTHRLLARALLEAGQAEEALGEAKAAVEIDKTEPWALSLLGDSYVNLGKAKEAEKAYKSSLKYLEKAPPGPDNVWQQGWTLLHLRRYDEALSALLDALSRKPEETGLDLDFALATLCSGRHDSGIAEYYRAVASAHEREERGRLKGLLLAARFDLQISIPYHRIARSSQLEQIMALLENAPKAKRAVEALWVDDKPANNTTEMQVIGNVLGVRFETVTDTNGAIARLKSNPGRFAFVISDMARGLDRRAGLTLLRRMREADLNLPTIIYAASSSAEREAEAKRHGAIAMTNSPTRLHELVSGLVRDMGLLPDDGSEALDQAAISDVSR